MTSLTPPSFVDDGEAIEPRMPRASHWNISKWLEGTPAIPTPSLTSGSTYTGSFVDDGADMLIPSKTAPGFGLVDPKFYVAGKKRETKEEEKWSEDMQRAIGGDMLRSLAKMRQLTHLNVTDPALAAAEKTEKVKAQEEKKAGKEDDDTVAVRVLQTWGTFVITGKDGRVVVVDEEGEYDSGPPGQKLPECGRKSGRHEKTQASQPKGEEKREDVAPLPPKPASKASADSLKEEKSRSKEKISTHSSRHSKRKSSKQVPSSRPPKSLTPIPEADTPEQEGADLSPTKFFMTGGASGWSSPLPSPVKQPSSAASPVRSLPGAWPSPLPSPTKPLSVAGFSNASPSSASASRSLAMSKDSWKEDKSWKDRGEGEQAPSPVKQPSLVASPVQSTAASSARSASHSEDPWGGAQSWTQDTEKVSVKSSRRSKGSRASPAARSKDAWTEDGPWTQDPPVENLSVRSSHRSKGSRVSSVTDSKDSWQGDGSSKQDLGNASMQTWEKPAGSSVVSNADSKDSWQQDAQNRPVRSTRRPQAPSAAGLQGSWGKGLERRSTRSSHKIATFTVGSDAGSQDSWQQDKKSTSWKHDSDNRSTFSAHSVYKPPTVEDAPETPAEEVQEWISGWTVTGSQQGSDKAKSETTPGAGWSVKESETGSQKGTQRGGSQGGWSASWNGSEKGSDGSGSKRKDKSGYDEDNETWLNASWSGIRVREAEWKKDWKDV
ncbi:hypothetical protein BU26DRAFT_60671 [Trematosphaeria pertusa]|uniref:Uncharacterized protein n=1 Tax=Trematosphaeria pertusa TaxID=390896 RepID=A0A6A6I944_9PLEO|nr:uncharacterized protein BU26DRAFT_60671 [Trematosphaeria pertusa]KAF2246040.1 hypothetical protein BU26DRAFT_60671 [Trematosphaeria pertusa]